MSFLFPSLQVTWVTRASRVSSPCRAWESPCTGCRDRSAQSSRGARTSQVRVGGRGFWDLRQDSHPLLWNLHRPQEVGLAPPGWLLVGVRDAAPRIALRARRELEECVAPGCFSLQGNRRRGPRFTRSHSLTPRPALMGPMRPLFNSPLGIYIQFIAPVNSINHCSIHLPWELVRVNGRQLLALGVFYCVSSRAANSCPFGFPFHYISLARFCPRTSIAFAS